MTDKNNKLDLIDIIEAAGLGAVRAWVYCDLLPLYASIERRSCEDDALHACSRYIHKHIEHYKVWIKYDKIISDEGTPI